MTAKAVIPRQQAVRDAEEIIDHYLAEGGETVASGFVDSLERAYRHLGRHPASGSSRYAYELSLPGLRHWPLKRYPYLVFYIDQETHIDVWRILHAERDIPVWMRTSDVT